MNITKYQQRLLDEWKNHNGIIIALDFDDTIKPWREDFTDVDKVINIVKEAQKSGATIIIYTGSQKDRHEEIETYCAEKGIKITAINENVITPFGDNRKIYANIYLDDRAGLLEALDTLEWCIYAYRSFKESIRLDNPGSTEF